MNPNPVTPETELITAGELAYRTYGTSVGGLNWQGQPMPVYADLPEKIGKAWEDVARSLFDAFCVALETLEPEGEA